LQLTSNTATHQEVTELFSVHIANVTCGRLDAATSGSYRHKQCMCHRHNPP